MTKKTRKKDNRLIPIRKKIGEKIRRKRGAMGMERKQLADKLKVTQGTVSNFETGRHSLSAERLWIVAAVLGCSAVDLLPAMPQDLNDFQKQMKEVEDKEAKGWLEDALSSPVDL